MMIQEIRAMPVILDGKKLGKIHESVFRSSHIVRKIQYWLEKKVPPEIILELIGEMEAPPFEPTSSGITTTTPWDPTI